MGKKIKQLQFQKTNISICASCQFRDNSINSVLSVKVNKESVEKQIEIDANILKLAKSTYHQHFTELTPNKKYKIMYKHEGIKIIFDYSIRVYDNNIFIFSLNAVINESIKAKQVNYIINSILNENVLLMNDKFVTFQCCIDKCICSIGDKDYHVDMKLLETFSIINPEVIQPSINADSIIGSDYEMSFYEATIRRVSNISETNILLSRKEQINLSAYKDDLIYLNYHNLFIYIPSGKNHLPAIVYSRAVEYYKVYIAQLRNLLFEISEKILSGTFSSNRLKYINAANRWVEKQRLFQLKTNEFLNESLDLASTRLRWFFLAANVKYDLSDIENKIEKTLSDYECIVSRKLESKHSRIIENLTILLTILSIIISFVGVATPLLFK